MSCKELVYANPWPFVLCFKYSELYSFLIPPAMDAKFIAKVEQSYS